MNWKDVVKKEISDKDIKEMLEEDYDEEFETGERGSDNSVQRDRDDTFNPDLTEEQKKELGKAKQAIKEFISKFESSALNNPKTKKEFVDNMTDRMLDALKREYRKKS